MASFGEEVKRLASEKGLTQTSLAEACGVQQSFIGKLMRGESTSVGAPVLFKLAEALGVPTDHFKPFLAPDTVDADEPAAAPPAKPKAKGTK